MSYGSKTVIQMSTVDLDEFMSGFLQTQTHTAYAFKRIQSHTIKSSFSVYYTGAERLYYFTYIHINGISASYKHT